MEHRRAEIALDLQALGVRKPQNAFAQHRSLRSGRLGQLIAALKIDRDTLAEQQMDG